MAKAGKMTHGGGGSIKWHDTNLNSLNRNLKGGGAIFGRAYSKIRAKRKTYTKGYKSGEATKNWNEFKAPTKKAQVRAAKSTGMQSKLTKKKK